MMTKEHGRDLEKMWTAGYKYSWREEDGGDSTEQSFKMEKSGIGNDKA